MRLGPADRARVSGGKIQRPRRAWMQGAVRVNANAYSSRRRNPDNMLNCAFIDADAAKMAAAQPIRLRCALIREHADTAVKP